MIFNLNELNIKDEIIIEADVIKDDLLDKRILDLKDAKVEGRIYTNNSDDILIECKFWGTMYITDSISLESIPYDFEILVEENLNDLSENYQECYKSRQNTLDLKVVLWQNIVLEVPISYSKVEDAKLKGNGWELLNEEKELNTQKLEDLLKGDD